MNKTKNILTADDQKEFKTSLEKADKMSGWLGDGIYHLKFNNTEWIINANDEESLKIISDKIETFNDDVMYGYKGTNKWETHYGIQKIKGVEKW